MATEPPPRTTQDRYELQRATFDSRSARRRESRSEQQRKRSSSTERSYATAGSTLEAEGPVSKPRVISQRNGANHVNENSPESTQVNVKLESFNRVEAHPDVTFDRTVDVRPAVTHEEIRPHIHTIYEQRRTRSIHYHEHRTLIQPIIDQNPIVLPEQHWAQDHRTGEIFKIPNELGRQLDEKYGRNDEGRVTTEDDDIIKAMEKMGLETTKADAKQAEAEATGYEQTSSCRRATGESARDQAQPDLDCCKRAAVDHVQK
ncbi:hypothetical protein ACHAQH_005552 [Verticillium albo-atrum]